LPPMTYHFASCDPCQFGYGVGWSMKFFFMQNIFFTYQNYMEFKTSCECLASVQIL
jgi:hypothetical protein